MTKMAQFLTDSGMKTKSVDKGKCCFKMGLSMTAIGTQIRCTDKVSTSHLTGIDTKVTLPME